MLLCYFPHHFAPFRKTTELKIRLGHQSDMICSSLTGSPENAIGLPENDGPIAGLENVDLENDGPNSSIKQKPSYVNVKASNIIMFVCCHATVFFFFL